MRSSCNEMASRLNAGDWIAYKSKGDPDQPFWIGKTLPKSEWGNQCIRKNDSHGNKTIEGAIISRGGFPEGAWSSRVHNRGWRGCKTACSEQQRFDSYRIWQEYAPSVRDKSSCPTQDNVRYDLVGWMILSIVKVLEATTQGEWYWKEYGNVWRLDDAMQNEALELAGSLL